MTSHLHDSHARFEPALRLAIAGRWSDAVRAVVQAVADPESEAAHGDAAAEALGEVARMAADAGDPAAADEALIAALLIRPHHADRLHQRAVVRLGLGDPAEARALLDHALRLDPAHVGARLERSLLDARDGRLGEAVAALHAPGPAAPARARPATPPDPGGADDVRRDLAAGRLDAAALRLDRLIERTPARAALHALRGEVELAQHAVDDAVESYGRALELDPGLAPARLGLARAFEALGMRDHALEQVAHVLEQEPGHRAARELEARWSATRRRAETRVGTDPKGS